MMDMELVTIIGHPSPDAVCAMVYDVLKRVVSKRAGLPWRLAIRAAEARTLDQAETVSREISEFFRARTLWTSEAIAMATADAANAARCYVHNTCNYQAAEFAINAAIEAERR